MRQMLRWETVRARRSSFRKRSIVAASVAISGLRSQLLPDLDIEDLIDPAHAALAQFLDDLVAAGEGRARLELADRGDEGFGQSGRGAFTGKRSGAAATEARVGRIIEAAPRALQGGIPCFDSWTCSENNRADGSSQRQGCF
jgi:hypothetical protein